MATLLPSKLLQAAQNHRIFVEMKSGDTYIGLLVKVDHFMNLHLRDCLCVQANVSSSTTSSSGSNNSSTTVKLPDVFIRGNSVKGFCLPTEVGDAAQLLDSNQPGPPSSNNPSNAGPGRGKKGGGKQKGKGEAAGPAGRSSSHHNSYHSGGASSSMSHLHPSKIQRTGTGQRPGGGQPPSGQSRSGGGGGGSHSSITGMSSSVAGKR